jgi:hypothetical protein
VILRRFVPIASVLAILCLQAAQGFSPERVTAYSGARGLSVALAEAGPAPDGSGRVVAIGDIHGDLSAFVSILRKAELIDDKRSWTGKRATLVQTGDFTDRGADVRTVIELMMALEPQAQAAGGRVQILLGNHEAMNMLGDLRDVSPDAFASFADPNSETKREKAYSDYHKLAASKRRFKEKSKEEWLAAHPLGWLEYQEAFGPDGRIGQWLRKRPAAAHINGVVFMHGGADPNYGLNSVDAINRQIQRDLRNFDEHRRYLVARRAALPFFHLTELIEAAVGEMEEMSSSLSMLPADSASAQQGIDTRYLEALQGMTKIGATSLMNPNGPLWFRGFAMWSSVEGPTQIDRLMRSYRNATQFVVGHTIPATFRITPRFTGRVYLIDTGMLSSHYKGGRPSALEIDSGVFSAIYLDSTERLSN